MKKGKKRGRWGWQRDRETQKMSKKEMEHGCRDGKRER